MYFYHKFKVQIPSVVNQVTVVSGYYVFKAGYWKLMLLPGIHHTSGMPKLEVI